MGQPQRRSADGKIYSAPSYGSPTAFGNMRTWMYRKDIFEKHGLQPPETYEELYQVCKKLKELYRTKDYGPYAEKGVLHVGFISNNDITGGNSGSPVMNAKGQLIGLAFDGNWEAMSGDIAFEPALQRTISVDIRYVLFIIDKYAGATRLIDEMTIVR